MTPNEKLEADPNLIFADGVEGCELEVYLATPEELADIHGQAQLGKMCAQINLDPARINLQTIVHEVHHVVNWFSASGSIKGMEEEARYCGLWSESIIAELLRRGWTPGTKDPAMSIFNTDVNVALVAPPPRPVLSDSTGAPVWVDTAAYLPTSADCDEHGDLWLWMPSYAKSGAQLASIQRVAESTHWMTFASGDSCSQPAPPVGVTTETL